MNKISLNKIGLSGLHLSPGQLAGGVLFLDTTLKSNSASLDPGV